MMSSHYTPGWGELFGIKSSLEKLKTFSNLDQIRAELVWCVTMMSWWFHTWFFDFNLLALDAKPQHVLPVSNVLVFLNEVYISRQQKLPAPVNPRCRHVLQELLHILWRKLWKRPREGYVFIMSVWMKWINCCHQGNGNTAFRVNTVEISKKRWNRAFLTLFSLTFSCI